MGYNPAKQLWLNPNIEYLFDNEIIEYDMRDAGFSLVKQYHLLPDETIRELTKLGKGEERHIAIGKLQGNDKEFSKALSDKFAEIRKIFIGQNNLEDDDIVSVKKDAIFTIGKCDKVRFGSLIFNPKNTYTSYLRFPELNNMEIYYSENQIDIKGMGDSAVNRHRLYMLSFIKEYIDFMELKDRRIRKFINKFIEDYKFHRLDDGYYLEFNNVSRNMDPLGNYRNVIMRLLQIIIKEIQ